MPRMAANIDKTIAHVYCLQTSLETYVERQILTAEQHFSLKTVNEDLRDRKIIYFTVVE